MHLVWWFPKPWEIIIVDIKEEKQNDFTKLEFKVLGIADHKLGKIEVKKS